MWKYILQKRNLKLATKANAKEKAHLQTANPAPKPKSAKELFPSPLSPPLKKRINFPPLNRKNENLENK